jgi:hypothetical protein
MGAVGATSMGIAAPLTLLPTTIGVEVTPAGRSLAETEMFQLPDPFCQTTTPIWDDAPGLTRGTESANDNIMLS